MATVRFYLDEDVHTFIAEAVRLRGYEATTTRDQRRLGAEDPDQLIFTRQRGYTLVTYNVQDYPRLHYEWLATGKHHCLTGHALNRSLTERSKVGSWVDASASLSG